MQTFLPHDDIVASLEALDDRRLGKQRVEAMQILSALRRPKTGWYYHAAVQMWAGYRPFLALYYNMAIEVWRARGKNNDLARDRAARINAEPPWWFGVRVFHRSHQIRLWEKDADYYPREWMPDSRDLRGYVWPATPDLELRPVGGTYTLYCRRRDRVVACGAAGPLGDSNAPPDTWVLQTWQLGKEGRPVCWLVPRPPLRP